MSQIEIIEKKIVTFYEVFLVIVIVLIVVLVERDVQKCTFFTSVCVYE